MERKEVAYDLSDELRLAENLNRNITYLLGLLIFTFVSGILAYRGNFSIWKDALSYLGNINTLRETSNFLSFTIFVVGMIGSAMLCFRISNDLKYHKGQMYFTMAGIGFILLTIPSDLINILHSLGGALVVGSLWFFSLMSLNDLYKKTAKFKIILYHIILHGTVLPYAFLYFAGIPLRQAAQKFAVLGLLLIVKLSFAEYYRLTSEKRSA